MSDELMKGTVVALYADGDAEVRYGLGACTWAFRFNTRGDIAVGDEVALVQDAPDTVTRSRACAARYAEQERKRADPPPTATIPANTQPEVIDRLRRALDGLVAPPPALPQWYPVVPPVAIPAKDLDPPGSSYPSQALVDAIRRGMIAEDMRRGTVVIRTDVARSDAEQGRPARERFRDGLRETYKMQPSAVAALTHERVAPPRVCESCSRLMLKSERYRCGCGHLHGTVRAR